MKGSNIKIALTGFMGVGKSSVGRHLAHMLCCRRLDLDYFIESREGRRIAEIIADVGLPEFRRIETESLRRALEDAGTCVLSLGGGTWTIPENRELIRSQGFTSIWLESDFEHCWRNIRASKKDRPLAKDRDTALKLFRDRETVYCLADLHFIVRPGLNSYEIARSIAEQVG